MQHIIRGETDACYQSLDGILKGEHQDGRSGTKTGKERGRTLVDDDGNHHNHTDKDHHDLQHATDTIKILLTGGTGTVFQLTEGVDEHDDCADSHDGKVDRCQTAYNVFHFREFIEHMGQQHPDDDSGDDAAGRIQHTLIENDIIPLDVSLACNL